MSKPWNDWRKRVVIGTAIAKSYLKGVEDGEYPSKESGGSVDTEQPKHPCQPQQGKQHNSGHEELPIIIDSMQRLTRHLNIRPHSF